jgi:hypothetical protein
LAQYTYGPWPLQQRHKVEFKYNITRVIEREWKEVLKFWKKIQNSVNIFILNQSFFPVIDVAQVAIIHKYI